MILPCHATSPNGDSFPQMTVISVNIWPNDIIKQSHSSEIWIYMIAHIATLNLKCNNTVIQFFCLLFIHCLHFHILIFVGTQKHFFVIYHFKKLFTYNSQNCWKTKCTYKINKAPISFTFILNILHNPIFMNKYIISAVVSYQILVFHL